MGKRSPQLPNNLPNSNRILKGYLDSFCSTPKAFPFFRQLLRQNPPAIDSYTLLFAVKACTRLPQPHFPSSSFHGQQLHSLVKKLGFDAVVFLGTCLISFYSATGSLVDARRVFDEMPSRNTISWTCLISAYVDNRKPRRAIEIFTRMKSSGVEPDRVCLTAALAACADAGELGIGVWIHDRYIRSAPNLRLTAADLCLNNSLVDMYVKCGEIETARRLFDCMRQRDVTTWTSMIVGCAVHGRVKEALGLFEEMTTKATTQSSDESGDSSRKCSLPVVPNDVTFLGVLMACSHGGMVEEGKKHFKSMIEEYGIKPREPHLGCMVDLMCRSGLVKEAYDFIMGMPATAKPNAVVWRTLLGACCLNGNAELGVRVRGRLLALEPSHAGDDVTLSNMFASRGLWSRKMAARERLQSRRRSPGFSCTG